MVAQEPLELSVQVRILAPQRFSEPGFEGRLDADQGVAMSRSDDLLGRAGWPTGASEGAESWLPSFRVGQDVRGAFLVSGRLRG